MALKCMIAHEMDMISYMYGWLNSKFFLYFIHIAPYQVQCIIFRKAAQFLFNFFFSFFFECESCRRSYIDNHLFLTQIKPPVIWNTFEPRIPRVRD